MHLAPSAVEQALQCAQNGDMSVMCLRRPEDKKEKAERLKAEAEAREAGKVRQL